RVGRRAAWPELYPSALSMRWGWDTRRRCPWSSCTALLRQLTVLARRLVHGLWFDTIGRMVFSAVHGADGSARGELYLSLRSRVERGATAARITLPQGEREAGDACAALLRQGDRLRQDLRG